MGCLGIDRAGPAVNRRCAPAERAVEQGFVDDLRQAHIYEGGFGCSPSLLGVEPDPHGNGAGAVAGFCQPLDFLSGREGLA